MTTTPLSDHDYRALADFRYALRTFLRFSEDAARAAGLTPNQHQLLLAVRGWSAADAGTDSNGRDGSELRGAPSIGDVAVRLQLRHHSTVELVQRAEAAGLLSTAVDPDDHRRQRLRLTPVGEAKLAELTILHRDELARFRQQMTEMLTALD